MKNTRKGFTLIELLVVIAIIGLLSTLAVVALNSARTRSRDSKRVADIRQIQTALELAFGDNGGYPNSTSGDTDGVGSDGSAVLGSSTTSVLCAVGGSSAWATTQGGCAGGTLYMGKVPSNPTPNGTPYFYTGTSTSYQLVFKLETATGQLGSGFNCASPTGIFPGQAC